MAHVLSLESFEDALTESSGPSADFDQGYQEGLAAGVATVQAETEALSAAFVQTMSDIDFTYAEARGQILASLSPLLTLITEKVLPHCVAAGFTGQLSALLMDAAAADTAANIELHVHPAQQAAVEAAMQALPTKVTVIGDATVSEHAAWIAQGRSETRLDADRLLARIDEILRAIQHIEDRTDTYG